MRTRKVLLVAQSTEPYLRHGPISVRTIVACWAGAGGDRYITHQLNTSYIPYKRPPENDLSLRQPAIQESPFRLPQFSGSLHSVLCSPLSPSIFSYIFSLTLSCSSRLSRVHVVVELQTLSFPPFIIPYSGRRLLLCLVPCLSLSETMLTSIEL